MFDFFPPAIKAAVLIYAFAFGTIIGSFLSVLTYRGQRGEDFVKGRSRCPVCGHNLRWYDLFPLFSWIFLGGKCRYCKSPIPSRYPMLELFTGAFYAMSVTTVQNIWQLLLSFILFAALTALSLCDIETMEIPYKYTITIAALGVTALVTSFINPQLLDVSGQSPAAHIIGAFIVSIPFAVLVLFGGMGGGDVQLMAGAGLLLGWKIIPAAGIGIVTGSIFGLIYKFTRKPENPEPAEETDTPQNAICFGPFLAFGVGISFLIGQQIIDSYLKLIR
jgi:leader peptidase (prepilin peptidase)/N-methyltransferase